MAMEKRYVAAMLLAGVGDAMGYRNGQWEFCFDGEKIHEEMLTKSDSFNSIENDDHYVILPSFDYLNWDKKSYLKGKNKLNYRECKPHSYSSDNNKNFLKINDLKKLIKKIEIDEKFR